MPDKLIAKIPKADANAVSYNVSCDYKYLTVRVRRMLCIANIVSLEGDVQFDLVFKFSQDITYASSKPTWCINNNYDVL